MSQALKRRLDKLKGGNELPVVLRIIEPFGTSETERRALIDEAKANAGYAPDYDGNDLLVILRTFVAPERTAAWLPDDISDESLLVIIREIVSPGDRCAGGAA